ncbi:YIP1 family protein [Hazenella coriacea]|uniref:Yip1-like protein n=1 Tax=Hazenella coriacea TaxID=1179467 RepID=A0A4R3L4C1_9BACL|nr:YIP1 family protein [Hazenella coriacea]TCS92837.1 Yip1-like protein [Hazenella coriacea]
MIQVLKSYWLRIWKEPRVAIHDAMKETTPALSILLISLFGITLFVEQASMRDMGDTTSGGALFILAFIIGPILGALAWLILTLVIHGSSRLFGGVATFTETRQAVTWATIPYTSKWVLLLPMLLIFRGELFLSKTPIMDDSMFLLILFLIFSVLDLAMTVIYYVIFSKIMGEVNDFSAWKGFASIFFIPFTLFFLLIIASLTFA